MVVEEKWNVTEPEASLSPGLAFFFKITVKRPCSSGLQSGFRRSVGR